MARAQWSTFSNEQLSNLNSRNTGFCGYGVTVVTATGPTVVELLDGNGEDVLVVVVAVVELEAEASVVLVGSELGLDDSSVDITSLAADELLDSSVVDELASVVLEGEIDEGMTDDGDAIVTDEGASEEDGTSAAGLAGLEGSSVGAARTWPQTIKITMKPKLTIFIVA